MQLTRSHVSNEDAAVILKSYVERSIKAAYERVSHVSDFIFCNLVIVSFMLEEINLFILLGSKYHRA